MKQNVYTSTCILSFCIYVYIIEKSVSSRLPVLILPIPHTSNLHSFLLEFQTLRRPPSSPRRRYTKRQPAWSPQPTGHSPRRSDDLPRCWVWCVFVVLLLGERWWWWIFFIGFWCVAATFWMLLRGRHGVISGWGGLGPLWKTWLKMVLTVVDLVGCIAKTFLGCCWQ